MPGRDQVARGFQCPAASVDFMLELDRREPWAFKKQQEDIEPIEIALAV